MLAVLAVVCLLVVLGGMWYARREVQALLASRPLRGPLSRNELAYLVGGPRWVVAAAAVELVRAGVLRVADDGAVTVVGGAPADPIEAAVRDAAAGEVTWLDVAGGSEIAGLRRTLVKRELLRDEPVGVPSEVRLAMVLGAIGGAATFAGSLLEGALWVPVVAGLAFVAGAGWLLVNGRRRFRLTVAGYGAVARADHRVRDQDVAKFGPDADCVAGARTGLLALVATIMGADVPERPHRTVAVDELAVRSRQVWVGLPAGGPALGGWLALGGADGISGWRETSPRSTRGGSSAGFMGGSTAGHDGGRDRDGGGGFDGGGGDGGGSSGGD